MQAGFYHTLQHVLLRVMTLSKLVISLSEIPQGLALSLINQAIYQATSGTSESVLQHARLGPRLSSRLLNCSCVLCCKPKCCVCHISQPLALQGVKHFKDIRYTPSLSYGELLLQNEYEMSCYNMDQADVATQQQMFKLHEEVRQNLLRH